MSNDTERNVTPLGDDAVRDTSSVRPDTTLYANAVRKRKKSSTSDRRCDSGNGSCCMCRQSYNNWINSVK